MTLGLISVVNAGINELVLDSARADKKKWGEGGMWQIDIIVTAILCEFTVIQ